VDTFYINDSLLLYNMIFKQARPSRPAGLTIQPPRQLAVKKDAVDMGSVLYPVEVHYIDDVLGMLPSTGFFCAVRKLAEHLDANSEHTPRTVDMIEAMAVVVRYVAVRGGIVLVMLPGLPEIHALADLLQEDWSSLAVHVLHSSVSQEDVAAAIGPVEPSEKRVVLGSAIAESSITIPDVVCVVDCGVSRDSESEDLFGSQVLADSWSSRATSVQRKGRAGRTQPGSCYRLYTKEVYELVMSEYRVPVRTTSSVAEIILQAKVSMTQWGLPEDILSTLHHPPSPTTIQGGSVGMWECGLCLWDGVLHTRQTKPASLPVSRTTVKTSIDAVRPRALHPFACVL
jgi:HrpA-like RNA helicase